MGYSITNPLVALILAIQLISSLGVAADDSSLESLLDADTSSTPAPAQTKSTAKATTHTESRSHKKTFNKIKLSYLINTEKVDLTASDGRRTPVYVETPSEGLGYDFNHRINEATWVSGAELFFVSGLAQTKGTLIPYTEVVKPQALFLAKTAYYLNPTEKVFWGPSLGVSYMDLKLEPLSTGSTQYTFQYANSLKWNAAIDLGWSFMENWTLEQSLIYFQGSDAHAAWNISIGYLL